ncbi:MAG: DUF1569 domain-containing protein [Acidobacteria bacterium]|nr:DUF1569 domain-containing protein [Acidobacteriota bacterium]MBI3423412.1 DUF1569 domain-containing protein [Acidobacteriota bacterium]
MKSLNNFADLNEILTRLSKLRPDSPRQWGKMTPHQMLCHLSDSYLMGLGERDSTWRGNWFTKYVMKWLALSLPLQWPHGIKTVREADQELDGTPPAEFEQDRQKLERLIRRFAMPPPAFQPGRHSMFGVMSEAEWRRWGYLHADHHFRQFGE